MIFLIVYSRGRSVGYADTARHSLALELRYARSRLLIVELASARSISGTRHDKIKTRIFAGLNFMGRVTRFELATFGTTNRRSNQLSYTRHNFCVGYPTCLYMVELIRLELTSAFACHQVSQPVPLYPDKTFLSVLIWWS